MESPASTGKKVPLGYRFNPTDEELVGHYLKHKLLGDDYMVQDVIAEVDVCKIEPWDLPAFSKGESDGYEWYFFSRPDYKYLNSTRSNRTTEAGFWKATGKDRDIKKRGTNNVIGMKKTLVFYEGRVRHAMKTKWVIHEYHAVTFPPEKRSFVLCRLIEKAEKKSQKKAQGGTDALVRDEGEPRSHVAAGCENQAPAEKISDGYDWSELESIFPASPQGWDYDFSSLLQSPIPESNLQDSTPPDPNFWNENSMSQWICTGIHV